MLEVLAREIDGDPRFESRPIVELFGVDEPGAPNWTATFSGIMPNTPAADAMREIMRRVSDQYDVRWLTVH